MSRIQLRPWSRRLSLGLFIIYVVLGIIFIIMFYPFFYTLSLAVMPYKEYVKTPVHLWPRGFTLQYFQSISKEHELAQGFLVSILRTIVGSSLGVVVTAMAGYSLSRRKLGYRHLLTFLFIIPLFFNPGIIPFFLTVRATGLLNTFWALVIPFLALPMWVFISRAYYLSFPEEIIESVYLDGGGEFRAFWLVIWPASTPLLATLAIMYGSFHWNEYFWSRILVRRELWPATVHLYNILQTREILQSVGVSVSLVHESFIAAIAALLIIPVLIIYPYLQRYVVKGIMLGSVKE